MVADESHDDRTHSFVALTAVFQHDPDPELSNPKESRPTDCVIMGNQEEKKVKTGRRILS
jgi:hypothetical protein